MRLRQRAKFDYLDLDAESTSYDSFSASSEESITSPVTSNLTPSDSSVDEQQQQQHEDSGDCIVLTPPLQASPPRILKLVNPVVHSQQQQQRNRGDIASLNKMVSTPVTLLLKPAPYRTIRNMDAIYDFLCERVKNQPALVTIASAISAAINRSLMGDASKINKVDTLTLAGTSGCGKTETVLAIKHLLGMDRGYEAAAQFDFIDGSTMSEPMQVNNICGAPTGTVGYGDGHTIADRLNKIINKPVEKKKPTSTRKKYPMIKASKKAEDTVSKSAPAYIAPPFIMLFIDELHMVSLDFMKAINGLIDTGEYATPNGKAHFIKPPETTLFIIFTCNYGAQAIASLLPRNDTLACKFIDDHMRDEGVPTNTIGRLGTICPYYPLETPALRLLLAERLNDHVQKTPLATRFGRHQLIRITEMASQILVAHVLKQVNADLGVRGAMKELLQKIDLLAEKTFSILHERPVERLPLFLDDDDEELTLTGDTMSVHLFDEKEGDVPDSNTIALIKKNPANVQALALCKAYSDEIITLDVMGMKIGSTELCQFIIPINITGNNNNVVPLNSSAKNDEFEVLQEKLGRIAKLVRNTTSANRRATIERIKNMIIRDEEEEDEAVLLAKQPEKTRRHGKKRKEAIEGGDDDMIITKRARVESEEATHIVSLSCHYNLRTKCYAYRCINCRANIDIRKTDVHICSEGVNAL